MLTARMAAEATVYIWYRDMLIDGRALEGLLKAKAGSYMVRLPRGGVLYVAPETFKRDFEPAWG